MGKCETSNSPTERQMIESRTTECRMKNDWVSEYPTSNDRTSKATQIRIRTNVEKRNVETKLPNGNASQRRKFEHRIGM